MTTPDPDCKPVDGSRVTLTTWRSAALPRTEAWVRLAGLLLSAVPVALYSKMVLPESAVTVTRMLPTPGGPSGRVKANWRASDCPGRMGALPVALGLYPSVVLTSVTPVFAFLIVRESE